MGLDMKDRRALTNEVSKRYKNTGKKEQKQILDEFTANTGYTRKYAIHLLSTWDKSTGVKRDGSNRMLNDELAVIRR